MATFDYARMQGVATRLIERFGQTGKRRRIGVTPDADVKFAVDPDGYSLREIDGTRVQVGDRRIYLSIDGLTDMKPNDRLIDAAGVPIVVVNADPISPAGTVVFYLVQGRGPK